MSGNSTSYVFETTDPLQNVIYLTHQRWYKITEGHPELSTELQLIKKTVNEPDSIYPDKDYEHTFCYYRQHNSVYLRTYGTQIKVVVDRNLQGSIKTAYVTNRNKEKTKALYFKSKTKK